MLANRNTNAMNSQPQDNSLPDTIRAIVWQDGELRLLDQRRLPRESHWLHLNDAPTVARAIHDMVVRGAPAIGISAAYGVVLAARAAYLDAGEHWREAIKPDLITLAAARPTAVNLHWALERMRAAFVGLDGDPEPALLSLAETIHCEDIAANRRMGELGAAYIGQDSRSGSAVLTHCNTGSLATGGFGTALGVIRTLYGRGIIDQVYATETRPWLQGARLTAWELQQDRIPATLIADSAAAALLSRGKVRWVIVGADRVAANGDVANKIGTYPLAIAARRHGAGFMVAAPTSTIDPGTATGADIPIEDRGAAELLSFGNQAIGIADMPVWNPVFDVTPAELVDALVTEKGVIQRPDTASLRQWIAV